ncbi:butyrophilin subfamily 1 member A1-like [Xyrichtys novacula]|uniref:Butyrophilin subfamily 1 member A1-like n=1 Tax=Xyrichtys novacula TaxID=13765 RepID=A0AAV1HM62_XYRNO|nr:butyrophilin subfamily 1 member A1-like [Xyrichtys novacula]
MGALILHVWVMTALSLLLCGAAPVSEGFTVHVTPTVSAPRGHTTTLPCWLNPAQSAEALEVRWYHPSSFDSPVLLYRSNNFEDASQVESYKGRVSFGLKDAASGGLKMGDVSLKLENLTIEDTEVYTCYVSSDQGYDSASVNLIVTQTGTSPLLSPVWTEDNKVNVSCVSEGWYPQPSLRWSDSKQVLPSKNTKFSKDSSGLLSVQSWVVVSGSEQVSCSVGLSGAETKEARVRLGEPKEAGSSPAGWVAFALLLIGALVALAVLYFKKREIFSGKKSRSGKDELDGGSGHGDLEEGQKLLPRGEAMPPNLSSDHYVNVTLDKTENKYLMVKADHLVRDAPVSSFPDGEKVTCLTAIKGTPGFTSGKHYWEVSLRDDTVGTKESWWVGITSETAFSEDTKPTTANGFLFLSSSPKESKHFRFNTEPMVLLPVHSRPETIGVYLNYDDGELSFYDVGNKSLIGSLKAHFTGEVFPFFNPGKGDKAPMNVLQRDLDGQCGDIPDSQPQPNNSSQP